VVVDSVTTNALDTFRDALADLGVGVAETTPADCPETVEGLLEPPAVAVPLDGIDCTLPAAVNEEPTTSDLDAARTGVTPAVLGVADYGSVLLESDAAGTEPVSVYPERHVAVLRAADVVPDMPAAFDRLGPRIREHRGSIVFATGPSATADMGDLVLGAHGPKEVHVVLVHDPASNVDETAEGAA
jgi:L-lactate dehydrogenase complex protein LldG